MRERHPVVLHGVSMSIGSSDGLQPSYLRRLRALIDEIQPLYVSDHLSWSRLDGFNSHDLLPLPYTEEALDMVCANIRMAQDALGRTMLFENPSSYLQFPGAISEWEFIAEMCRRTGCGLLPERPLQRAQRAGAQGDRPADREAVEPFSSTGRRADRADKIRFQEPFYDQFSRRF
jgi:uncharacterized protein (UPF0276 family)